MADTSQDTSRLAEEFRKMGHDTLLLNSLKLGKLQHRYVIYDCNKVAKHAMDTLVVTPGGQFSVWPHPVDANTLPEIPDDDQVQGAVYCEQYQHKLSRLEPIVEEFFTYLRGQYKSPNSAQAREAFVTRCVESLDEYAKLLVEICINWASHETGRPLSLKRNSHLWLAPADLLLRPSSTSSVVDDIGHSLLTVKIGQVSFDDPYPTMDDVDPPLKLEMTCRMYQQSLNRYQALYIHGPYAVLRFIEVPDVNSIFLNQKARVGIASYTFPRDRNGFVCHLINLLKNSDDYTKYFSHELPWEPLSESDPEY